MKRRREGATGKTPRKKRRRQGNETEDLFMMLPPTPQLSLLEILKESRQSSAACLSLSPPRILSAYQQTQHENSFPFFSANFLFQCVTEGYTRPKLQVLLDELNALRPTYSFSYDYFMKLLLHHSPSLSSNSETKPQSYHPSSLWVLHMSHYLSLSEFFSQCSHQHLQYIKYHTEQSIIAAKTNSKEPDADLVALIGFLLDISTDLNDEEVDHGISQVRGMLIELCEVSSPSGSISHSFLFHILRQTCSTAAIESYTRSFFLALVCLPNNNSISTEGQQFGIEKCLRELPKPPGIPITLQTLLHEYALAYTSYGIQQISEVILFVLQCKTPRWTLLLCFFIQLVAVDSQHISQVWEHVIVPFEKTIQSSAQQEDQTALNLLTDLTGNMRTLIVLSRFFIDSLPLEGRKYSDWFIQWIESLQNIKAQKQAMRVLSSLLPNDSAYYICIHIRHGLPPGTSKAMRKHVANYVHQGTKRLCSLGYLLSDTESLENDFFTESFMSRKILSVLLCFRDPRVPQVLNNAFLYHPVWFHQSFLPRLRNDTIVDQLPYFENYFTVAFPQKVDCNVKEELQSIRNRLCKILEERGMFEYENNEKETEIKTTVQPETASYLLPSWQSMYGKLLPKFHSAVEEWKLSNRMAKSSSRWMGTVEEMIKVLSPGSGRAWETGHPLWNIAKDLLSAFCESVEMARASGNLGEKFLRFVQELFSYETLQQVVEEYLQSLLSKSLHKLTIYQRNGLTYFWALLSSPAVFHNHAKSPQSAIALWNSLSTFPSDINKGEFLISYFHTLLGICESKEIQLCEDSSIDVHTCNKVLLYRPMIATLRYLYYRLLHFFYLYKTEGGSFVEYMGDEVDVSRVAKFLQMCQGLLKRMELQKIFPVHSLKLVDWLQWEIESSCPRYGMKYQDYLRYQIFTRYAQQEFSHNMQELLLKFLCVTLSKRIEVESDSVKYIDLSFMQPLASELFFAALLEWNSNSETESKIFLLHIAEQLLQQLEKVKGEDVIVHFIRFMSCSIPAAFLFCNSLTPSAADCVRSLHIATFFTTHTSPQTPLYHSLLDIRYIFHGFNVLYNSNKELSQQMMKEVSLLFPLGFLRFWKHLPHSNWLEFDVISSIPCLIQQQEWKSRGTLEYIKNTWLKSPKLCSAFIVDQAIQRVGNTHIDIDTVIESIVSFMEALVTSGANCSVLWIHFVIFCRSYLRRGILDPKRAGNGDLFCVKMIARCIEVQPCLICVFQSSCNVQCPFQTRCATELGDETLDLVDRGLFGLIIWQVLNHMRWDVTMDCWTRKGKNLLGLNCILGLLEIFESVLHLGEFVENSAPEELKEAREAIQILTKQINHLANLISKAISTILQKLPNLSTNKLIVQKIFTPHTKEYFLVLAHLLQDLGT